MHCGRKYYQNDYAFCLEKQNDKAQQELKAANESFKKLNIHTLNLVDRIRRLEEAGDMMVQHFYTDEPRSVMWEKAKEAKL